VIGEGVAVASAAYLNPAIQKLNLRWKRIEGQTNLALIIIKISQDATFDAGCCTI
jgi:hypothetical protein